MLFPQVIFTRNHFCVASRWLTPTVFLTVLYLSVAPSARAQVVDNNLYCKKGDIPNFGTGSAPKDGPADLPQACVYTGMDALVVGTHLDGTTATTTTINGNVTVAALPPLRCGDTLKIAQGSTITGNWIAQTTPVETCDVSHWILVESVDPSTGSPDVNFPAESTRATPCHIGLTSVANYPRYTCPNTLVKNRMAKFVTNNNLPAIALNGCTAPGPCASYWRFVGIEVTNTAGIRVSNKLVDFSGGNHMILDRSMIHGQDDPTFNQTSEVQGGVNFNGSYLAVIDSWVYNTFCANAPTGATCVDSQGVSGGTGPYPQKAQKILNNLVASSGESWFWGGGQQAHLTNASNPDGVSTDIEVRKNFSFKPLSWMLAICGGTCTGNKWDPKNLGETKATNRSLWEANVEQNSWTGWQSDQFGNANLVTPKNQSSKANGTGTVAVDSAFTDNKHIVVTGGTFNCELDLRTDAGYAAICPSIVAFPGLPGTYTKPCPPAGCRVTIGGATYHGQTVTDSTHMVLAEVLTTPGVQTSYCKRGLNPFAVVRNHTMRYNLIRHVTDVYEILTGESDCGDDALGVHSVSVHDNIAYDVDATFWTNSLNPCCNTGWVVKLESATTSAAAVPSEITVNHNTAALISFGGHNQGLANWFDQKAIPVYFPNIQFLNNITAASLGIAQGGGGYITGGQYGGANLLACSGHAAGSGCTYDIRKNLVLTGLWTSQGNDSPNIQSAGGTAVDSCTSSGTTTSGSAAACDRNVGFNGYSSVFTAWDPNGVGPFDLSLPAGSPYLLQGTDNKNLGADVPGTTAKLIGSDLNSTVTYAALSITTTSLPNGTLGQTYSQQLAASTGASPFKAWSLTAGSLPAGLTLGRNGLISGTPTAVGSSFTVRAVDASHQTATKSLSITIN